MHFRAAVWTFIHIMTMTTTTEDGPVIPAVASRLGKRRSGPLSRDETERRMQILHRHGLPGSPEPKKAGKIAAMLGISANSWYAWKKRHVPRLRRTTGSRAGGDGRGRDSESPSPRDIVHMIESLQNERDALRDVVERIGVLVQGILA